MQQGMSDYVLKKFQPIATSLQEYGTCFFFFFFAKNNQIGPISVVS